MVRHRRPKYDRGVCSHILQHHGRTGQASSAQRPLWLASRLLYPRIRALRYCPKKEVGEQLCNGTFDDSYIKPKEIVTSLVDISKNGNFLLDIDPKADGNIVEIEKTNLRTAGVWIKDHAEAIFNSTYWFIAAEEEDVVRFTQKSNAFYIFMLLAPNETLVLDSQCRTFLETR